MAEFPQCLTPERHRDLRGRPADPWIRRGFLVLFAAVGVAGLLNAFGQRSRTVGATGPEARLEVRGPDRVRGGLLYQQRVTVQAMRDIEHPRLVLARGWLDGQTVNTIEPAAENESSRDGELVLSYDSLSAGDKLEVFIDVQVNPTHVGRTDHDVELDDAERPLARVSGSLLTLP
jgi:hypothetical protein